MASSADVNRPINIDESQYDSVSAQALGDIDVAQHDVEFQIRIVEISSSWPYHHMQIHDELLSYDGDQALARRHTAFDWIAEQLDSIGSASLDSDCRFDTVHCNFNHDPVRSAHITVQIWDSN